VLLPIFYTLLTPWILLFLVNLQAAYLACSLSGSRPLSYAAENADGGANWAYLRCVAR
jgi:hypothetical protein